MKIGDVVIYSDRNKNHLGNDVCAYAGMTGVVCEIYENGGFCINCGTSFLIVTMHRKKGVWIYLNGVLTFHKNKDMNNDLFRAGRTCIGYRRKKRPNWGWWLILAAFAYFFIKTLCNG